jgi:hypothetical protein
VKSKEVADQPIANSSDCPKGSSPRDGSDDIRLLTNDLFRPQATKGSLRSPILNAQFLLGLIALNVFTYLIFIAIAFTLAALLADLISHLMGL